MERERSARLQLSFGNALATLGERGSGTERLEQAVAAYHAALEEYTRDRVPLDWAMTQNSLGNVLQALGERESGTKRLEQAVIAYRKALEERTRDRVPLNWATTQNNLGNALAIELMLAEKRQLADELIDGDGEVNLTELSDDELLDLVRLDVTRAAP